tara:strand:+ start:302 stop:478 length:177 start_codon:yes stop_codon:yes gene_type:complete
MNEEVNAILKVYQNRINNLTAQNIAFEAKILTLTKQVQDLQPAPESVDGGELEETKSE